MVPPKYKKQVFSMVCDCARKAVLRRDWNPKRKFGGRHAVLTDS